MNNFEQFENAWRKQAIVGPADPKKIQVVQQAADRIVKSRSRLLRWGAGVAAFSIFSGQLLKVVNYVHAGRTLTPVALANFVVLQLFLIGLLIWCLRRIRADRRSRTVAAASIQEGIANSLARIEEEMLEYRIGVPLSGALLVLTVIPLISSFHQGYFDAAGLGHRLLFIAGLILIMGSVSLRHYRRVLQPQRQHLAALLADLRAG